MLLIFISTQLPLLSPEVCEPDVITWKIFPAEPWWYWKQYLKSYPSEMCGKKPKNVIDLDVVTDTDIHMNTELDMD